jgi:diguanylate cyclase (GGDEF)-like protein
MAGDYALQTLVQRLQAQLRMNDILARYGGEEFVVLLPDTPLEAGLALAERLRETVALNPVHYTDIAIGLTISIGAAEADGRKTVDELLHEADNALYAAKREGRNRVSKGAEIG